MVKGNKDWEKVAKLHQTPLFLYFQALSVAQQSVVQLFFCGPAYSFC